MRIPNAGLPQLLVADYRVHEAVVVEVEQPDAVVLPVGGAKRLPAEKVVRESLACLAEIEELDLAAVLGGDVIDPLDQLRIFDPAVWVEDEVENTLLEDGGVDGILPVLDRHGVA